MTRKITIIGAGPGGYVAALRAAQLGGEVTIVEKSGLGGTCLNRGCIPSKIMKSAADVIVQFNKASEMGLKVNGEIQPDMPALLARKEAVIEGQAREIEKLFKKNRIRTIKGAGRVAGPNLVEVLQEDGLTASVDHDALILAPGASPMEVSPLVFDGCKVISSDEALGLAEIPETMTIVGGGVIGCEFAFIFSAFGCRVTVVEAMSRLLPLPSVDEDCSKVLGREMKKRGIKVMTSRIVSAVTEQDGRLNLTVGPSPLAPSRKKEPEPVDVEADQILVCVGRRPNTDRMGLEAIGLEMDERGWIRADMTMRTNLPDIYAIGDVLGPSRVMLAHVASAEGIVAAENAMGGHRCLGYEAIPGAIFTMPEAADVGLTESQAGRMGIDVRADSVLFRHVGKAQAMGEVDGQAKIVSEIESGRILGVHIVGPHATDLIAEGTLAVKMGLTLRDLAGVIHAHPTLPEVMFETALKGLDKPIHG